MWYTNVLSTLFYVPQCAKDLLGAVLRVLVSCVCYVCLVHDVLRGQCVVRPYKDEDCLLQGNKLCFQHYPRDRVTYSQK